MNLPKKLGKEPLIDAIFELRFNGAAPASLVLPGYIFANLDQNIVIESMPIAQVPKNIRDADQNLKYSPINRLDWDKFFIGISDHSIVVSCKHPYPGWSAFKKAILKIVDLVKDSKIALEINRYSMKYIDILDTNGVEEIGSMFNLNLEVAGSKLKNEHFNVSMNITNEEYTHTVQIISAAQALLHNQKKLDGAIVDIDSVVNIGEISLEELMKNLPEKLEEIHIENKTMFFSCITKETLKNLDPAYD